MEQGEEESRVVNFQKQGKTTQKACNHLRFECFTRTRGGKQVSITWPQFKCECELRPDCSKTVPVEKLCFLPIELALLRNDKFLGLYNDIWHS